MNRRRRLGTVSLVVLTLLSVGVVAEAERNYAAVTDRDGSNASVSDVAFDERLEVTLRVHNSMNQPVRIQYVHVDLHHAEGTGGSSTSFNGYRTLDPGTETMTVFVPARLVGGSLSQGDRVTVSGTVAVQVYNGYRFEIPIDSREVEI